MKRNRKAPTYIYIFTYIHIYIYIYPPYTPPGTRSARSCQVPDSARYQIVPETNATFCYQIVPGTRSGTPPSLQVFTLEFKL